MSAPEPAISSGTAAVGAQEYDDLVRCIYRSTVESSPWESILTRLRDLVQAYPVALLLRPAEPHQRAFMLVARKDNYGLSREEFTGYGALDGDAFTIVAEDLAVTDDDLAGKEGWLSSAFFRTWVEPFNIRYTLGAQIRGEDGSLCQLRICRPVNGQPFSSQEKALCQALIPHFKEALGVYAHINSLQTEQQFYADAVDRLRVGTVLLDGQGRVIRMNHIAEKIVAERDGLSFSTQGLEAHAEGSRQVLREAIAHAVSVVNGKVPLVEKQFFDAISIGRPSGRAPLAIRICALPLEEGWRNERRPALALLIRDPGSKSQFGNQLLRQLFGLTPAEAALAQLLAEGLSLDAAAAQLGVRKNTARVQLSSIFGKTGVTRQSSLVSLLLSSAETL